MQQAQSQSVITKKTSIAAKLRKVFISRQQQSLFVTKGLETREGIVSLSSSLKDEANGSSGNSGTLTSTQFATGKHRGSTSSNSSADTALGNRSGNLPFRRCSGQTATPLTSPENSPPNSPTIKVSPSLMIVAAAVHDQAESPSSIFNPSFLTLEAEGSSDAASASISALGHSDLHDKSTLRSLSSKSIKRRLSFASISSFFGSRNNNTPQESRAKQHRSFSVPHVENPLTVGRQIAGFQRRHSLNDLHDHSNGKLPLSVHHHVVSPLSSEEAQNTSVITSATNRGPSKKLSFNNMFSKQKKKSIRPSKLAPSASAKPLKSALVHRSPGTANDQSKAHLVHSNAYRRSSSVRSQSSSYCQQYRHYPHYNQHHHQCPSQHALSTTDSLTHLAEANHSLASLSRRSSIQEDDGHDIYQQSYNYLPCSPTVACNSCTSRLSLEGPNDGILGTMATNIMNVVTANALSTPTPRILPTITIETGLNNDIAYEAQYCSLPQHLSPILSRSSSCRSFSSSSESVGEAHQSSSSSSSSSSISGSGSCSSSSCSIHFEINHTLAPTHKSGQLRVNGSSCRRPSDNQTFNPLLPAFAARVSVDHIALDSHQSNSITTEAPSIAYESPSTISNSSTEDSSASSTCTNVTLLPLANSIGYQKRDLVPLQHLGGYHDLQCQQEATVCLLYDQNEYEDERAYEHGHEHEHEQQYHHYAIDHDEYEQRRHLIEYQRQQHQYHHLHHLDLHHQEQHCYVDWASIYPPRPPRQLQFSTEGPTVFPTWTPEQYDRTSDTSTTASRLTPATAQRIKLELNQFKRHEMEVHQDSQIYTHYFL
ncbi:hypothetical protein BCR41DRAFT_351514 [Lobosporangium transversale]|uniref:Uncharacterized protein n=1 Tax=Lobosporangium transversale TaxID=64571 RepID=A0A1Y2GQC2_9FUNG|nr:hypothetical protein BCR41DRAFT_351514 [Lobosporangium transversale]ORZ19087.1 hypothetical protein BCR41DRAFT_351514 [Lobosporangium transversale]|eukprot:XP_021882255.1 hypothetical protein BCR41DRAFT_351514 [Lobosporangium transversale]